LLITVSNWCKNIGNTNEILSHLKFSFGEALFFGLFEDSKLAIFVTKVGFEKLWPLEWVLDELSA
jgi:hypothetical protein